MTMYTRGGDNAFLGTGTPSFSPLPAARQGPTWNAGFIDNPLDGESAIHSSSIANELIRMSRQALPIDSTNGFLPGRERSFRRLWRYRRAGFWISLLPIYVQPRRSRHSQ